MTPGIALDAIDTGMANLARHGRDLRRDRPRQGNAANAEIARTPLVQVAQSVAMAGPAPAPTAAFAAGLISHQTPPRDAMLDRQRLMDAEHALPERGELPLTDRLV